MPGGPWESGRLWGSLRINFNNNELPWDEFLSAGWISCRGQVSLASYWVVVGLIYGEEVNDTGCISKTLPGSGHEKK